VDVDPFGWVDDATDRRSAVFQALGAASACWENLSGAGVFDSTRAKAIGEALLAKLEELDAEGAQA
jgi:hypothetical protein